MEEDSSNHVGDQRTHLINRTLFPVLNTKFVYSKITNQDTTRNVRIVFQREGGGVHHNIHPPTHHTL